MEIKNFIKFELKADEGEEGTFSGYGSVYNNVDNGDDIVAAGAFTESINSDRKVKMLWQHNAHEVIGVWTSIEEDEKGLRVTGKFANTPRGNEVKELIKIGAIEGLSIGYKTIEAITDQDYIRTIIKADLWEVSLVTFPMNESATIDSIKAQSMTKTELEKFLTTAGLSRSVAKGLIAKGYDSFNKDNLREADSISDDKIKLNDEITQLINKRINILK